MESNRTRDWERIAEKNPEAIKMLYGCQQATEILDRTAKIMRRLAPKKRVPHGFYDPAGFFESLEYSAARIELRKIIQTRISEKVLSRDSKITFQQMLESVIFPMKRRPLR